MTRFAYVMAAYFAAMTIIITAFVHPAPRLVWNATASVPVGLYWLQRGASPRVGDLVAVTPPGELGDLMARRRYLPFGMPMLKHVAALGRQRVCRVGREVSIDGRLAGSALENDGRGRPLPVWHGCVNLASGQVFLMNAGVPDSFDGRYFGTLPAATIAGRLTPIWTH